MNDDDVIRAKRFELLDDQGRTRAWLKTGGKESAPYFALADEKGLERIGLLLDEHGLPCIRLLHESGQAYAGIRIDADGYTLLTISRPDGTVAIQVVLGVGNETTVKVLDASGRHIFSCGD
jgi:hypothetical protein